jgi:prepilin-type N-terminal cleavage/methylation domain-containing protein
MAPTTVHRLSNRCSAARGRAGFTFIELIVGLAIMVMIATAVAPVLLGGLDAARVEQGRQSLDAIAKGMAAFHYQVTTVEEEHPSLLTQLSGPISAGQPSACGAAFTAGDAGRWGGPYLNRVVPSAGVPIGIGIARNQLVRQSLGGSSSLLKVLVDGVTPEDAVALDREVDGNGNASEGTVRWGAADAEGLVTLEYAIPIRCGAVVDDGDGDNGDGDSCPPGVGPPWCRP